MYRITLALLTSVLIVLTPGAANSQQQNFPDRSVRLITPYPPGGSTNTLARLLGQKLAEEWNQQVVVENRPGGNTVIGYQALAQSKPDGYTIMLMAQTPHVFFRRAVPNLPFDEIKDFTPVATLASSEFVLVVNPALPVNSVKELIDLARSKPDTLNFASSGTGTTAHLASEYFNLKANVKMQHVPYKGSGPAIIDLLGGQVEAFLSPPAVVVPHINAGKLRALAVSGNRRLAALPDLPTFQEAGLADFDIKIWYGILAPAGTPREITGKLSSDIERVMNLPAVKESLATLGMEPFFKSPEQFVELMHADRAKFANIIDSANIRFDN